MEDLIRVEETRIFFSESDGGIVREIKSGHRFIEERAVIPAEKSTMLMKYDGKLINIGEVRVAGQVVLRTKEEMTPVADGMLKLAAILPVLPTNVFNRLGRFYNSWQGMLELYTNPRSEAA